MRKQIDKILQEALRVAMIPKTSPKILAEKALHPDKRVRRAVAMNRNSWIETLELLARDPEPMVREGVACNELVPVRLLMKLSRDVSMRVRRAVARNVRTPVEVLAWLVKNCVANGLCCDVANNPNACAGILEKLAQSKHSSVRFAVARHLNTLSCTLRILSKDEDQEVRIAVITNSNTPLDVIETMAQNDLDFAVRHMALECYIRRTSELA